VLYRHEGKETFLVIAAAKSGAKKPNGIAAIETSSYCNMLIPAGHEARS
jgi:hypothetical protein